MPLIKIEYDPKVVPTALVKQLQQPLIGCVVSLLDVPDARVVKEDIELRVNRNGRLDQNVLPFQVTIVAKASRLRWPLLEDKKGARILYFNIAKLGILPRKLFVRKKVAVWLQLPPATYYMG